jgi:lysylphosphatidylglycerol synthetase-like protein (DUF2156 family)
VVARVRRLTRRMAWRAGAVVVGLLAAAAYMWSVRCGRVPGVTCGDIPAGTKTVITATIVLLAVYVIGYGVGRLWIELLRVDPAGHLLGVRVNVWVSLLAIVGGTAALLMPTRRREPIEADEEAAEAEPDENAEPEEDSEAEINE